MTIDYMQPYPRQSTCPDCGRCRTCGHGPSLVPQYPNYPYGPNWLGGTGSNPNYYYGGGTVTTTGNYNAVQEWINALDLQKQQQQREQK